MAFEFTDAEIERLPQQLASTLVSAPVQDAIKKTLLDFAKSKTKTGGTVVSGEEAKKLVEALHNNVKGAGSTELLNKIKGTPEYLRLEASINAFKRAAESSALGVWIDKNKNVLYLVGAALVVGTASVLYVTRTGGSLLNTALDPLEGKKFEVLQIGKLTLKAGLWDFQPDARILGARVFATVDWKKLKLDLKFGLLAEEVKIQQAEGEAVVKSGPVSLSLTADAKPQVNTINLGLKVGYQVDKFNLGLGAMYKDDLLGASASANYRTKHATLGLTSNVGQKQGGGLQYGALFTVTIPIQ